MTDGFEDIHRDKWKLLVRHLRNELPPAQPVSIRRRPMKRDLGGFWPHESGWIIAIAKHRTWPDAVYDLTEEWAHALTHAEQPINGDWAHDHGPLFGLNYSKTLRVVIPYVAQLSQKAR